jgi:hypothetical protein
MRAIKERDCFSCKKDLKAKVVNAPDPLHGKISKQPRIRDSYVEVQIFLVMAAEKEQDAAKRDFITKVFCRDCASNGLRIMSDETMERL